MIGVRIADDGTLVSIVLIPCIIAGVILLLWIMFSLSTSVAEDANRKYPCQLWELKVCNEYFMRCYVTDDLRV